MIKIQNKYTHQEKKQKKIFNPEKRISYEI